MMVKNISTGSRDMRGADNAVHGNDGIVGFQGFIVKNIESRPGQNAALERMNQSGTFNKTPSAGIDDI